MYHKIGFFIIFIIIYSLRSQGEILRFKEVSDRFFRGSQPETEADYQMLKENNIDTIINLRWDKSVAQSKLKAESHHLRFINIPIRGDSNPTEEQVNSVLSEINKESNGKVYLHCTYGKDRTGLIAALYRVNNQGWSPEAAKNEWIEMGFAYKALHGLRSYFFEHVRSDQQSLSCLNIFNPVRIH